MVRRSPRRQCPGRRPSSLSTRVDALHSAYPSPAFGYARGDLRQDTDIPIAGAHTLPQEFFISPELFAQERERIFARRWVCIGRESKIAKPGRLFLAYNREASSIIVLRDQSGEIRAHYNTCRASRRAHVRDGVRHLLRNHPVSVPRLDVRARRPVGAQTSDSIRGIRQEELPARERADRELGGIPLHQSERASGAVRTGVRVAHRPLRALQSSRAHGRAHDRVRRQGELEARVSELFRVLSLLAGPSAAHQDHAIEQRRERSVRGPVPRRLHGDQRAAREPVDERPGVRRAGGRAG